MTTTSKFKKIERDGKDRLEWGKMHTAATIFFTIFLKNMAITSKFKKIKRDGKDRLGS